MTTKHFIQFADAFSFQLMRKGLTELEAILIEDTILHSMRIFESANARFDRKRFVTYIDKFVREDYKQSPQAIPDHVDSILRTLVRKES